MNRTAIKNFAVWARCALREQVRTRLTQYGIKPDAIASSQQVAGGLIVAGQTLDEGEAAQYRELRYHLAELSRVQGQKLAIETLIDEIAYTWFNRLAALRYMEVNGYVGRVLSSSDVGFVDPDILRDASAIAETGTLPGLNFATLEEWRTLASRAANVDEFLYRRLLMVQCEALADGIPFLFNRSKFYMGLFLPANLLNQDSIVRRLVNDIPESDWQAIEIVGWLYQFYISERKDEVIGAKSKVSAQDIPAATQLFTPHWIVRYMVENSVGRLWLEGHPESRLREVMPYYLEPRLPSDESEETEPAAGQLELPQIPTLSVQPSLPLTPQELTVCDPACGSGHILVYAFDLLFEIYREQGYRSREIPGLILAHNLVGLDIDDRAVQLASFAVLMKARQYDARILRKPPRLNAVTVRSTRNLTLPNAKELMAGDWQPLLTAFEDADHLGSLITPPGFDESKLMAQLDEMEQSGSVFTAEILSLRGVVLQAQLLRRQYWAVVANPPYMNSDSFSPLLKQFVKQNYERSSGDLFAVFMERTIELTATTGLMATINQHAWMFLTDYRLLRESIILNYTILNMLHLGIGVFSELNSKIVQSTAFVISKSRTTSIRGVYFRLLNKNSPEWKKDSLLKGLYKHIAYQNDFSIIPGSPIAYWISDSVKKSFRELPSVGKICNLKQGLITGKNERFLRYWFEVPLHDISFECKSDSRSSDLSQKWFPLSKGGDFRRWYGNNDYVVNWKNNGYEIKNYGKEDGKKARSRPQGISKYFHRGITWSALTSSPISMRVHTGGSIFSDKGQALFPHVDKDYNGLISFLNSSVASYFLNIISPTLDYHSGYVSKLPIEPINVSQLEKDSIDIAISISQTDWDSFEYSWAFQIHPLLQDKTVHQLSKAFATWKTETDRAFQQLKQLEEENNRYWIDAYGLQDELTPEVPDDQITIRRADLPRDIRSLISYAVGCMMGRYSLDKPGLIHAGQPFDPTQHTTYPADLDGILPITDQTYFDDDLTIRFIDFIASPGNPIPLWVGRDRCAGQGVQCPADSQ